MSNSGNVFEQPIPPSVKEILTAYATRGDGDRDVLLAILHAKTAEDQRITAIATLNDHMVQLQRQALEATVMATQHQALQQQQQQRENHHRHVQPHPPNSKSPRLPSDLADPSNPSDGPSPNGAIGRPRPPNSADSTSGTPGGLGASQHRRSSSLRDRDHSGSLPSPPISYLRSPSPYRNTANNNVIIHAEAGPSAPRKRKHVDGPQDPHLLEDAKKQKFVTLGGSTSPSPLLPPILLGASSSSSTREPISPSSSPPSQQSLPQHPTSHSRMSPPVSHSRPASCSPPSSVYDSHSRSVSPPPAVKRPSRMMDITSMLSTGGNGDSTPTSSSVAVSVAATGIVSRTPVQLEWSSERSTSSATVA